MGLGARGPEFPGQNTPRLAGLREAPRHDVTKRDPTVRGMSSRRTYGPLMVALQDPARLAVISNRQGRTRGFLYAQGSDTPSMIYLSDEIPGAVFLQERLYRLGADPHSEQYARDVDRQLPPGYRVELIVGGRNVPDLLVWDVGAMESKRSFPELRHLGFTTVEYDAEHALSALR